ncbi:hypothetical protein ElyMa_003283700 [Elysia marginata]|uniref:Uncharacterized protein n=1 Tax=Elysia marginata TaxID=1093978 RepID=A0AAV4JB48_9GAST|nr:hypothetical protein ElyMa_003283700 [Elysia marginata]
MLFYNHCPLGLHGAKHRQIQRLDYVRGVWEETIQNDAILKEAGLSRREREWSWPNYAATEKVPSSRSTSMILVHHRATPVCSVAKPGRSPPRPL